MSYRYMRVVVFFDLPILTGADKKAYRDFRKFLLKSGYLMMQESVYCKLATNSSAADTMIDNIRRNRPPSGLVQVLKITEKQYTNMAFIVGKSNTDVIDSDERLIIL